MPSLRFVLYFGITLALTVQCDFAPRPEANRQNRAQQNRDQLRRKAAQGISDEYAQEILTWRAERDKMFKNDVNSPLSDSQKSMFRGMAYFSLDSVYRLEARVLPVEDTTFFSMKHTNGQSYDFRRFCRLRFSLHGETHTLTAYQSKRSLNDARYAATLFLPFTDATNGETTYGGGRYLDIEKPAPGDSTLMLDFNRAYNPYCAYSADYACPIPPGENRLRIPIEAGEKDFR